jgi:hypothetical protein
MRSAFLWGAAQIAAGQPLDQVVAAAMRAGQNLEPLGEAMMALAAAAR